MLRESRIIRDILTIIAFVMVLAACTHPAEARFPRGGALISAPPACAQAVDNGCAASPGGSVLIPNLFTGYTGTAYGGRPNYNVPCVDYKCGSPDTANGAICGGTMQDPATATTGGNDQPGCGILPAHCAYSTSVISAQLTIPIITCAGTSNAITLKGFNMKPVGGHGSTYWLFTVTATGHNIVEYNQMQGDPGVYYQNAFGNVAAGNTGAFDVIANTIDGKWVSNFSTQGTGSCTISGTAMSCTGDSGFAVGQYINGVGVAFNTVISSVNGGGSYTTNQSNTVSTPETITSQFQMAGGINIGTSGKVTIQYNAILYTNGRPFTVGGRASGNTSTTGGDLVAQYNYIEDGITSTAQVAHYENVEDVLGDGGAPITWTNWTLQGNVLYQSTSVSTGSTTGMWFISPGGVSAPIAGSFLVTYTNPVVDKNVSIIKGSNVADAALAEFGGQQLTNLTMTNNWISKVGATHYNSCTSNPNGVGTQSPGPVSFFTGSDDGLGTLTVSAFAGGGSIIFNGTNVVAESHGVITGQLTGTPGGVGTYSVTGDIAAGSQNMRSAYPAITNTPTISGNVDLDSNSAISASNIISREVSANPCVYPGMQ